MKKFHKYTIYQIISVIVVCSIFIAITKCCNISPNIDRSKIVKVDTLRNY